ncbi:MAG: M23 family metallopeptidase, partial [Oscillospiraceae bacterium]|nr:M23 family metallopeptidase [Oscillospiraceae bacterium]
LKDLHRGIDIGLPEGTEIRAGISGAVTVADYDGSYGNYIVIESADGIEMKYAHCHTLLLSAGDTVEKGDVIATVGSTGASTGAHLHMEILKNGVYLNPIFFVETFYY